MSDAPITNRPAAIADLDSIWDGRTSHAILDVHDTGRLAKIPGALAALGELLDKLNNEVDYNDAPSLERVTVTGDGGSISVKQELADDEAEKLLKSRQAAYDRGLELWQKYLDDGTMPTSKYVWDYYLRREQIETQAPKVGD
ncbi:hypothetical protein SEA_DEXDERT_43 [Gordonia phage Dexdert]|uniref:Uncharacterized protein n=1 Tax=Gordonia phage Dexdert TaxID=2794946 RepID=A0A7T1NWF6_9CAUD|nr:hypothetical protein J1597_gp43 [Gordonia phage Dexdert]QPO17040.1 hypothetical protein SEA_DEXDERT_43 [Gordonia phage Dexdert]